jgi:hypothetical protein
MFQKPSRAIAKLRNKHNNNEQQMDNKVTWSLAMHSNIDKAYELVGIQWNLTFKNLNAEHILTYILFQICCRK